MSNSTVRKIKIFLSSPGDVQPERDAVKRAVSSLKTLAFIRERFDLDVYAYEDTTPAVVGAIPQQVVNNYTLRPEEADIYICIFWGRMGTSFVEADITYPSGTYYEFEHAYEANQTARRPIMLLYRKTTVVPPENLDGDQYQQVNNFFATFHTQVRKGLYLRFDTLSELEDLIKRDLWTALVKDLDIFQQSSVSNETELRNLIIQRFEEANVELLSYPHLIGDSYTIERDEPQRIIDWINDTTVNEKIALLVDKPGTGKTVVMSTILSLLKEQNRTVLGIKADHLSGITTVTELQERLQLPVSLEDSIRIVATNQPIVVLIDQVDALSISLSQDFSTLDLIFKFVMVLGQIPGVRVVVSCREFDLNFDPTLSRLKHKQTPTFSLPPLGKEEVSKALTSIGVKSIEKISERMFQLLSTPLHLSIYAKLLLDSNGQSGEQFYSLHQLYDALWKRHITASTVPFVSLSSTLGS